MVVVAQRVRPTAIRTRYFNFNRTHLTIRELGYYLRCPEPGDPAQGKHNARDINSRANNFQFYQDAWLNLVDAIASLIDEDSGFVFDALDGKTEPSSPGGTERRASDINYRDEPAAFFFVLFGLAFEALASRPGDSHNSQEHTLEILQALKKILRPSVAGHAIYQEIVFAETMDLLDRLTLTESLNVQSVIVEIARNLCVGHPSARKGSTYVQSFCRLK